MRAKNNLGPDSGGFGYDLEVVEAAPGVHATRVLWGETLEGTARELLARAEVSADDEPTMTSEAESLLRDILSDGRALARNVKRQAAEANISDKALRRARERLRVQVHREGFGAEMKSYWLLPEGVQPSIRAHSCPSQDRAKIGHE